MERLTWRVNGEARIMLNGIEICGTIADRLAAYEETGLEPEDILRILDAYGRGMTLRTENAQRLEIVKGIQTDRLRELAEADRKGRVLPEGSGWFVTCSGKKLTVVVDIEAALRREQDEQIKP